MGHFAHQDNNSHINFILSSFFKKLNDLYKSESINSKKKNLNLQHFYDDVLNRSYYRK